MKPRHFLIMLSVGGFLLLFGQTVFAMPILIRDDFRGHEQRQNNDSSYFSQTVEARDCGQGLPTGQVREQDLTPLIIAWLASILLTIKIMRRVGRSGN